MPVSVLAAVFDPRGEDHARRRMAEWSRTLGVAPNAILAWGTAATGAWGPRGGTCAGATSAAASAETNGEATIDFAGSPNAPTKLDSPSLFTRITVGG